MRLLRFLHVSVCLRTVEGVILIKRLLPSFLSFLTLLKMNLDDERVDGGPDSFKKQQELFPPNQVNFLDLTLMLHDLVKKLESMICAYAPFIFFITYFLLRYLFYVMRCIQTTVASQRPKRVSPVPSQESR